MIKLMIGLLIIACIAPLFLKGSDGEPLMTIDDWKVEVPIEVKSFIGRLGGAASAPAPEEISPAQSLQVFKWQDADGQWHFGNAPPDLATAEEVTIGNVNLMEAYVPATAATAAEPTRESGVLGSTVPGTSQIREARDAVEQLQQAIDQRQSELDGLSVPR